jgi:hypothetical protein
MVTKPAIEIDGEAAVIVSVPAVAACPLSTYEPLTAPNVALKSPVAIPPLVALIVTVPV